MFNHVAAVYMITRDSLTALERGDISFHARSSTRWFPD